MEIRVLIFLMGILFLSCKTSKIDTYQEAKNNIREINLLFDDIRNHDTLPCIHMSFYPISKLSIDQKKLLKKIDADLVRVEKDDKNYNSCIYIIMIVKSRIWHGTREIWNFSSDLKYNVIEEMLKKVNKYEKLSDRTYYVYY